MISKTDLDYLNKLNHVAVFGATGAIGGQFMSVFESIDSIKSIHAFSRSRMIISNQKTVCYQIDYSDERTIIAAKESLPADIEFDCIIICTGILHASDIMPEKSMKEYSTENAQFYFLNNTIGPSLVVKHFSPLLNKNNPSIIAAMCARIGSIEDNKLGGWYSYRASKAALAMMIKSASIELTRRNKNAICVTLHPGTVDSALSQPFHKHIKKDSIISPEQSVTQLISVIASLGIDQTGNQYAYDGARIPF